VAAQAASDGCWPLITNDQQLTHTALFDAYHHQPAVEGRHHLLKGVLHVAPVWLKSEFRIDALGFCFYLRPRFAVRDGGVWLDVLYSHVAGIDVHKKQVTVTARIPDPRGAGRREKTRAFGTFCADLLAMGSWLAEQQGDTGGDGVDRPVLVAGVRGVAGCRRASPDYRCGQRRARQSGPGP
jgi:hypothetical protein